MGEEANEELELGNRECDRIENVGVIGEGTSEEDEDREGVREWPIAADSGDSKMTLALSLFLLASTSCGSRRVLNSRMFAQLTDFSRWLTRVARPAYFATLSRLLEL